jgi:hypothetical protein
VFVPGTFFHGDLLFVGKAASVPLDGSILRPALPANIRLAGKKLPRKNTLAYFAAVFVIKKKNI